MKSTGGMAMKFTITFLAWIVGGYLHDQGGYPFLGYAVIFFATLEFFGEAIWPRWKSWRAQSSGS